MMHIETLKKHFGYTSFRDGQETLINSILSGSDTLGIMPTGAGKSICFQIPGLMFSGVTLVISPLISLMKDQVNALTQSGISAAFINSSLTDGQITKALQNAARGMYKLIYIAPERLLTGDFLAFAKSVDIAMLTVDEAHCISQWGQDFRPSYTAIPEFISKLSKRPIVSAFTATATPQVKEDIVMQLKLNNPVVTISGFDRPNLYFDVKRIKGDKFSALEAFLQNRESQSGIVYCATRGNVEEVCDKLRQRGFSTSRYHAGLSDSERHENQDDFLHDRVQIMVATNAFGMGIDKSNVSFVVHYNMPMNLEGYYQEAGRAGRDGEPATCLLLYGRSDVSTAMWMIENQETEEFLKERNIKRLQEMDAYCTTSECLRGYILKYFGETPPENCEEKCINCETDFEVVDITTDVQKIISCVARMKERFGVKMILDTLRGKTNAKVTSFGLDKLSTFGISKKSSDELREVIDYLVLSDYLHKTTDKFPIIKLGQRAKEALSQNAKITMKIGKIVVTSRVAQNQMIDSTLLEKLKSVRLEIAKEQKLPAFVIFHDSTLADMCKKLPITLEGFLKVSGVGQSKAEKYGEKFLSVISEFEKAKGIFSTV
ncbi:MAG: DNA helicase RecQ [Defluviitaleaceae bacterium]|nr:DNA helicase RecQ [Defluviitaleaceae bacterium]